MRSMSPLSRPIYAGGARRSPPCWPMRRTCSYWQADFPPPEVAAAIAQRPVTHVSWFAARAYCRWQQKRLPSSAEWELVALASETAPDGRKDPGYQARLLEWYTLPTPAMPPLIGSGQKNYWGIYDLHGSIWEWVADFQTAFVTGDCTR